MASLADELSDYERLRIANIAKNQIVMKDLGLENSSVRSHSVPSNRKRKPFGGMTTPGSRKSLRSVTRPDYYEAAAPQARNNFSNQNEKTVLGQNSPHRWVVQPEGAEEDADEDETFPTPTRSNRPAKLTMPPAEDSSRSMKCDIGRLMTYYLGKAIPQGLVSALFIYVTCCTFFFFTFCSINW
jgi:hypothetical protein